MISGGDHTIMYRWQPEGLTDEERRCVECVRKYEEMRKRKFSARIPLQSPPDGGASFSPGEAVCAAAQELRSVIDHPFLFGG